MSTQEPLLMFTALKSGRRTGPSRLAKMAILGSLFLILLTLLIMAHMCPTTYCPFITRSKETLKLVHFTHEDNMGRSLDYQASNPFHGRRPSAKSSSASSTLKISFEEMARQLPEYQFDIQANDVMVFLHIQKTGGTSFGRHLVHDLELETPCQCHRGRKQCRCSRPGSPSSYWLFSRYSMGWQCGLHADWTELTNCVDMAMDARERSTAKRRYFYVTYLRQPVTRFISEFRHVRRGATWAASRHWCGGRTPSPLELPSCYSGPDWSEVNLSEFMSCKQNLAVNRMTRMLADLSLVGCYNNSVIDAEARDLLLLASAKENLRKMSFFGLCEQQKISQYLFESTFGIRFRRPFIQLKESLSTLAEEELSKDMLDKVAQLNHLDIELYQFADKLLKKRFQRVKKSDDDFEYEWSHLGTIHSTKEETDGDEIDDYEEDEEEELQEVKIMRKVARKRKLMKENKKLIIK